MTGIYAQPITSYYDPGVLLTDAEVEHRLNIAPGWLEQHREQLQAMGFPEPSAAGGERWDAGAVWGWQRAMAYMNRSLPSLDASAEVERKFGGAEKA